MIECCRLPGQKNGRIVLPLLRDGASLLGLHSIVEVGEGAWEGGGGGEVERSA